ncbi:MAG: beta strand repeat-containing protein [Armatimonadota bacterium]
MASPMNYQDWAQAPITTGVAADDTEITVDVDYVSALPPVPFRAVIWQEGAGSPHEYPLHERITVTEINDGNVLTVERTEPNDHLSGCMLSNVILAADLTDVWAAVEEAEAGLILFDQLTDVDMAGVLDGQVPIYDEASTTWLPGAGGGETGPQGIQGEQGIQGIQGEQGLQGERGLPGEQGLQGIQGTTGETGATGLPGNEGEQGIQGEQGGQGIQGEQGVQGVTGETGATGLPGADGDDGAAGLPGEIGIQGEQGIQGIQGVPGDQGTEGEQGLQGIQGVKGDTGATGLPGSDGAPGVDGADGVGIPAGGTAAQVLAKVDGTDFNTQWVAPATGGVTGGDTHDHSGGDGALIPLTGMADMASTSILGRKTASAGVPEVLSASDAKIVLSLGNVNNTTDLLKPISTATQTALNLKAASANGVTSGDAHDHAGGDGAVIPLAGMANVATASLLGRKTALTGVPEVLSAADAKTLLALNNVDNTTDLLKPVSTATQAALDLKGSSSLALGETVSTAYRGDRGKTAYDHSQIITGNPHVLDATDVGAAPTANGVTNGNSHDHMGGDGAAIPLGGMATMAQASLLGRKTASTGIPEVLSATDAKTLLALVKGDVGLGNVDNTTDLLKPISTATQTALDLKAASAVGVTNGNSHDHNGGDGALIPLAGMATLTASSIMGNNTAGAATPIALTVAQTKTLLALGNVDNTSDAGKPVSTAQATAIALKADAALGVTGGNSHDHNGGDGAVIPLAGMANMVQASLLGRKTASTGIPEVLSATDAKTLLSLGNVDNTTDAGKPVSTAQATAIGLKADAALGVTNGNTHNHAGGDGAQVDHGGLGGLADDDHTQYLRADGTRGLTGNLAVAALATIDGVDISAHTHSGAGQGGGVGHAQLDGLGNDHHTQYHTDARGDARYVAVANVVTNGNNHDHSGGDGAAISVTALSQIAASTLVGNGRITTGIPETLTVAQAKALLVLGNVDNTTDAGKPVSTATQTALNLKADATHSQTLVNTAQADRTASTGLAAIAGLVATIPGAGTYTFEAILHWVAPAGGGVKFSVGVVTSVVASAITQFQIIDNATNVETNTRIIDILPGTGAASVIGPLNGMTVIRGTVVITSGAGTIAPRFGQSTASGTSNVLLNSSFVVTKV